MGLVTIDTIDPAYDTVDDGNRQTTAACEAGVDVARTTTGGIGTILTPSSPR
jgi:hypothetical protein